MKLIILAGGLGTRISEESSYRPKPMVEPDYWSPNRIEFSKLDAQVPLSLNMNPSSAWHNNGIKIFPDYKIIEVNKRFDVMPDKDGIVILTYVFPGKKLGVITTVVFLIISILVVGYFRRKDMKFENN